MADDDKLNDDFEDDKEPLSLVERVFFDPDNVSQGEYWAIYEFLLDPDIKDDPEMVVNVLKEFSGWAQYMLGQIQERRG
jgi:hypothetical protein